MPHCEFELSECAGFETKKRLLLVSNSFDYGHFELTVTEHSTWEWDTV